MVEEEIQRSQTRSPQKKLRVTYPNGEVICYAKATMTFMEFLRRIDVDKLPLIKLELAHLPLISQECYPQYKEHMKTIRRGWFVNTHGSDTSTKYRQMKVINNQLELNLKIEIGTDFETSGSKGFHKTGRQSSCILVKFSDGHFVGESTPKDTFIETIKHIGIEEVKKKRIELSGMDLITSTQQHRDQMEIAEGRWLTIPDSTKDKVKWLRIIAAYMRNNMEVSMI